MWEPAKEKEHETDSLNDSRSQSRNLFLLLASDIQLTQYSDDCFALKSICWITSPDSAMSGT